MRVDVGDDGTCEVLMPAVSIVVPCRNEMHYIEICVRSILAQESPAGGFEVIVADGMSDDGTRDILDRLAREDPRLQIVDNPGRIVPTGLNAAVRVAQGQIIIRMDAHTEYAPDYVRQCVSVLQETGADNVGGPWVAKGVGYMGRVIAAAFQSPFSAGGACGHDPSYEGMLDTVYLGCWPIEVFERIGLFDEELVRNQDDEFNLRLIRAGGKIWQSPRIRCWYRPRGSLGALFRQYMQYGYWKVRVIQKHKIPASARHLVPSCFVLALITLSPMSLWWSLAGWGWLGLVGTYWMGNIAASLLTAARQGWKLFPLLPPVFACYHLAYGYGFLRGVWDFLILRRGPALPYTKLTRTSADHASRDTTVGQQEQAFRPE
jgi:succinoglycan biosynthesis protein ExoA